MMEALITKILAFNHEQMSIFINKAGFAGVLHLLDGNKSIYYMSNDLDEIKASVISGLKTNWDEVASFVTEYMNED